MARMKQCLAEISPLYAEQLAETCLQAGDNPWWWEHISDLALAHLSVTKVCVR